MTAPTSRIKRISRPVGLALYGAMICILAIGGPWLVIQTLHNPTARCSDPNHVVLPDDRMLAWAVAALIFGRLLGRIRYHDEWGKDIAKNEGLEALGIKDIAKNKGSEALGIAAWTAFLFVITGLLFYEAIGVLQAVPSQSPLEPITYYVRCAIFYDKKGSFGIGLVTYAVIGITNFLVGHWLWAWHPPKHRPEPGVLMHTPDERA